jgi:parallel beta-helix repeat protein
LQSDHLSKEGVMDLYQRFRTMNRILLLIVFSFCYSAFADQFAVTNTNDSGAGSLRQAIIDAEAHAGADEIVFNIPPGVSGHDPDAGIWVIEPLSVLPGLEDATIIDGTTQAAYIGGDPNPDGPEIVIDGSSCGYTDGLFLDGSKVQVLGLVIRKFQYNLIHIRGDSCRIAGCYLGPDFDGHTRYANFQNGIQMDDSASYNIIGGNGQENRNVISGNQWNGIRIVEAFYNEIRGNYIGIDAGGTDTLSNGEGIRFFDGKHNIFADNIISGNRGDGIFFSPGSDSNLVIGNRIGTDPGGVLDLGNQTDGIYCSNGASFNTFGGSSPELRNIISGNEGYGIHFWSGTDACKYNSVIGNYIGTDITGTIAIPNGNAGISLRESTKFTTIGGESEGEGNIICSSGDSGIEIWGLEADSNQVIGNIIGTDVTETLDLGNGAMGINILGGADHNTIGPENHIAYNTDYGILISGEGTIANTITENSIHHNGLLGILIQTGGNSYIESPVITGVGSVHGTAPSNSSIEIFTGPDNEGMTYLATVLADGAGEFYWEGSPAEEYVTATATDNEGNTSAFSPAWHLAPLMVTTTADTGNGSLRWAIEQANTTGSPDTIRFDIPFSDAGFDGTVWTIIPQTELPDILSDGTVIEGYSQTEIHGDTNPAGPEIMLDGRQLEYYVNGLEVRASSSIISGLIVSGFYTAIAVSGEENQNNWIWGNYIGITPAGDDTITNKTNGIYFYQTHHNIIGGPEPILRNVISGNGVGIKIFNSDGNSVQGNFIGTNASGNSILGNDRTGVEIYNCSMNVIGGLGEGEGNVISGNGWYGIDIEYDDADSNQVLRNWIGTDMSETLDLGNLYSGVLVAGDAQYNQVGPGNVIRNNKWHGVEVSGALALFNLITQNSISNNGYEGIDLNTGGNRELMAPIITSLGSVQGKAVPNSIVEIFSDSTDQGRVYEGFTTAGVDSHFSFPGTPSGPFVTATATTDSGHTSEFSLPKRMGSIIVTTTSDSVEGSLRWAMETANTSTGPDRIEFNIPASDPGFDGTVWIIRPEGRLPYIADSGTVIDGGSQRVNQGDTNTDGIEVMINFSAIEGWSYGLYIQSAGNTISELGISGCTDAGITLSGFSAHHNWIWGNLIGTNETGTDTIPNYCGIQLYSGAHHNTIGGTEESNRNIISGNHFDGIYMTSADSNRVIGNTIGLNKAGTDTLKNKHYGIQIRTGSRGNIIGGSQAGEGNIISGNGWSGISITEEGTCENSVQGNFIGTDYTGTKVIGNGAYGITIEYYASANVIGGPGEGEGNIIAGNSYSGIQIAYQDADSNLVAGNWIGTDESGLLDLGNDYGISMWGSAQFNVIGPDNRIRFNRYNGIYLSDSATRYNTITQNSIANNGYNGIELNNNANGGIAAPVITGTGSVQGTALPNSTIEIFSDSTGQGRVYEGVTTADGSGHFFWTGTPAGPMITATATDDSGSTSMFSSPKLAGSIIVVNTDDSGEGSLRWAITLANQSAGPDTIVFNIPTSDPEYDGTVWWIRPETKFPNLSGGGTCIDGSSQQIIQGNTNINGPEIVLDGINLGEWEQCFYINSSDNVISGLTISRFKSYAIDIRGVDRRNNRIIGNYIGTNPAGTDTSGNYYGVYLYGGSLNTIGGASAGERNIISGNKYDGILFSEADSNFIKGNYIGLDRTGTIALRNGIGIGFYDSPSNQIGGTQSGEGNVISGNEMRGIELYSSKTRGNAVLGNYIGTDKNGTSSLGNGWEGINISSSAKLNMIGGTSAGSANVISGNDDQGIIISNADSNRIIGNRIGTDVTGLIDLGNGREGLFIAYGASQNQIGPGNIISGNGDIGINIYYSSTDSNIVTGNWIGLNAAGNGIIPNDSYGIRIQGKAKYNHIGGPDTEDRNIISGNRWNGISLTGDSTMYNVVERNWIGVQSDGKMPLPNEKSGIILDNKTTENTIGPDNKIWYNTEYAIVLWDSTVRKITITQNSIMSNVLGGIDLRNEANDSIAAPVILTASPFAGTASPNSTVEVFADSADQGMCFLGSTTADGSGNWTYSGDLHGPNMTATATDDSGNTSEFSGSVFVSVEDENLSNTIPEQFYLSQNYPNPFNPETTIRFGVIRSCRVRLTLYNMLGQEIQTLVDKQMAPGQYDVILDAGRLETGMYFYRIRMGDFTDVKKMVLLK